MNNTTTVSQHSPAWVAFTYISFAASAFMVGIGIWFLPLELSIKGYLTMGFLMLIQSCITMTKTMRDNHESGRGDDARRDNGREVLRPCRLRPPVGQRHNVGPDRGLTGHVEDCACRRRCMTWNGE